MKLLFKQRFFSWFDSYDIYDEDGNTVYTVKGQLSWGHLLNVYDAAGEYLGRVKEKVLVLLPEFEIFMGDVSIGSIKRKFLPVFRPAYSIDFNGWKAEGNFMEWDYTITDDESACVATVSKELFRWTDTYTIDILNPADALCVLMFVLAIDAEKCS